jgi:hypothetical protein
MELMVKINLLGGFNPSETYWSIGDDYSQCMENKTCLKPPTCNG